MRAAVESMGGDVSELEGGIARLEPHLEDVSRVAHPLRRLGDRAPPPHAREPGRSARRCGDRRRDRALGLRRLRRGVDDARATTPPPPPKETRRPAARAAARAGRATSTSAAAIAPALPRGWKADGDGPQTPDPLLRPPGRDLDRPRPLAGRAGRRRSTTTRPAPRTSWAALPMASMPRARVRSSTATTPSRSSEPARRATASSRGLGDRAAPRRGRDARRRARRQRQARRPRAGRASPAARSRPCAPARPRS